MKGNSFTNVKKLEKYVEQLMKMVKKGRFQSFSAKKRRQIIQRMERLQRRLSLQSGSKRVRRALAAAAVAIGLAANPAMAQDFGFKPAQTNPFNLTFPTSNQFSFNFPTLGDLDGDGDYDMLVGDYSGAYTYFENTGNSTSATFGAGQATQTLGLPSPNSYFKIPTLVDIDGDGDLDVISAEYYGVYFYQNTGTSTAPSFSTGTQNIFGLPSNTNNYITGVKFVDIDDDGDLDAFYLKYDTNSIIYYENTGSSTNPSFSTPLTNPFGLSIGGYDIFLEIGDIDGDGDYDIITGAYYGDINYYENTGTATMPTFATGVSNAKGMNMKSSAYTYFISPALADIDNDGDLDLFGGEYSYASYYSGIIKYQENNQAPTSADATVLTDKNVDYTFMNSDFAFTDADDSTYTSVQIASLPMKGALKLNGNAVAVNDMIAAADIPNLVFSPEMDSLGMPYTHFSFQVSDGHLMSDTKIMTIEVQAPVSALNILKQAEIAIAPNPVAANLNIEVQLTETPRQALLTIVDFNGRTLRSEQVEMPNGTWNTSLNVEDLPAGVYLLRLTTDKKELVEKFVKQ